MNAPNFFQWLPTQPANVFLWLGFSLAATVLGLLVILVWRSHVVITPSLTIHLAVVSVLLAPFFLPRMHERYFFPADVLSIVFAFYFPKYSFATLVIVLVSFFSYYPFLFGKPELPLPLAAFGLLMTIFLLMGLLFKTLYPGEHLLAQLHTSPK